MGDVYIDYYYIIMYEGGMECGVTERQSDEGTYEWMVGYIDFMHLGNVNLLIGG